MRRRYHRRRSKVKMLAQSSTTGAPQSLRASSRIARTLDVLDQMDGLDGLLITDPVNVRYLAGQPNAVGGACLISPDFSAVVHDRRGELPETPRQGFDTREPADFRSVRQVMGDFVGVLGYEDDHLTVADLRELKAFLDGRGELVAAGGLVDTMREIKSSDEIERIGTAAAMADAVLEFLAGIPWAGKTERDISIATEVEMLRLGAEGPSFPSIVTRPPANAMPHAASGASVIEPGDLVLVDLGVRFDGYLSDITRMYSVGPADADVLRHYAILLDAQERGIAAIADGVDSSIVDAAARDALSEVGLGEYFGHSLGHGVGMTIHEDPRLSPRAVGRPLRAGNVVTVEPGLYFPGKYGLRIEDLVVVGSDSAIVLSAFPKASPTVVA
jgi:Xaa-Pro aminopeptidase